jgi:quercetin dioxygenase-like cupin family protein
MAIHHACSGEVVDLNAEAAGGKTAVLIKNEALEVIRLTIEAGGEIPTHRAPNQLVVQCLSGKVEFTANDHTETLTPGKLLHLACREPHSLKALERSVLLLTLLLTGSEPPKEEVQEASEESFPASDSPAWTGVVS